ncbi:MAG: hypothetical protein M1391_00090 [Bacteroidetes bacterium]|nr:hypothetical protein [Bacteroidota bacterium]
MAIYFVIAAVVVATIQAFMQSLTASRTNKQRSCVRFISAIGTGSLTAVWLILLWFAQQYYTQEWNSRPVIDIFVDKSKFLKISNLGLVNIEDITVNITQYLLSKDYPLHTSKATIQSFNVPSCPIGCISVVKCGTIDSLDLKKWPNIYKFYKDIQFLRNDDDRSRTFYCIRILFRNSINRQRFVRYVITSPLLGFPDGFGDYRDTATGGGYLTSLENLRIRELIRNHQAAFYDDRTEEFYRN